MNFSSLSDDNLIALLQEGNTIAFDEIYNRYWLKLYSAAYKRLKDREPAQEIVQELFTSFWINRFGLVIHTSLQGYLFSSIRYLVLNYIRHEAVKSAYSETAQLVTADYNPTEEYVYYNDLIKSLEAYINKLPAKCRSVFDLSRNQFKTNKEIAKQLGISEKTVENHLTKAIRFLKQNITAVTLTAISLLGMRIEN